MEYDFLVDTYDSERLKTLALWSMFEGAKAALPGPGDKPSTERPDR